MNVRFGSHLEMTVIPNTDIRRDGFTNVTIPWEGFGGTESQITFTLVSRENANEFLEINDMYILKRVDTDLDGLTDIEEALGTSLTLQDSDSDKISD